MNEDMNDSQPITGITGQAWRKGDESDEFATDPQNGDRVPAETETWYKAIPKPVEFDSWSMDKRAGWRAGIDSTIDVYAQIAARHAAVRLLAALIETE